MRRSDGGRREATRAADVLLISAGSAAGRLAIGLGLMVAPRRALAALGFGDAEEAAIVIAQVAGVRDIVLAATTLISLDDEDRLRAASLANAVADAGDALSFLLSLRRGGPRSASIRGMSAAVPASISSLWVAWRLR
jgi:hypothetical protein